MLEPNFSFEINLNLPLYSSLKIPFNAVYIGNEGIGIKGIFVINNGSGFLAWEASCPNHAPNDCSAMGIVGGINCQCACEDYTYSLVDGSFNAEILPEEKPYGLLNYRTSSNGDIVVVSN